MLFHKSLHAIIPFALVTLSSLQCLPQTYAQNLRQENTRILESTEQEQPGDEFDFYVLSMSYQPEFCYQNKHKNFPGCENPRDFWRQSLTLHGLWPEDDDGSWPSNCSTEQFDPKTIDDLGPDRFAQLWPNVKASEEEHSDAHYGFWKHEWEKHGTCTGLTQDEYFDTALKHFFPTPPFVHDNYGLEVSKVDLLNEYRGDVDGYLGNVVLVCSGGKYLSEVRICVAKYKDGTGAQRIRCTAQVEKEANCPRKIVIPKFYIDEENEAEVDLKIE